MMTQLIKEVSSLKEKEYKRAAFQHGPVTNSPHEAYALIKEELEEAQDEMKALEDRVHFYWLEVKGEDPKFQKSYLEDIGNMAVRAACELIQVAAMSEKALAAFMLKEEEK